MVRIRKPVLSAELYLISPLREGSGRGTSPHFSTNPARSVRPFRHVHTFRGEPRFLRLIGPSNTGRPRGKEPDWKPWKRPAFPQARKGCAPAKISFHFTAPHFPCARAWQVRCWRDRCRFSQRLAKSKAPSASCDTLRLSALARRRPCRRPAPDQTWRMRRALGLCCRASCRL
jgi:hypothetical protein